MKIILGALGCEDAELSVSIIDDREMRKINKTWLRRDRPTDVIAFSQLEGVPFPGKFMGDVVISLETARRNARARGLTLDRELDRLLAHGILHLLGHDHVKGGKKAAKMRDLEDMLVAALDAREQDP